MTQQSLADLTGIHVTQIRRYETGKTLPTLEAIRKLALGLSASADSLVFEPDERGPDDDLRLQFEAASRLNPEEKRALKMVIESILVNHEAKRWASST